VNAAVAGRSRPRASVEYSEPTPRLANTPTRHSVTCQLRTVFGRRGRVYVSQVDDDVWIGGDTVTGVTGIVHE
jgi:hypothetical protein